MCLHQSGRVLCCVLLYCDRPECVFIRVVVFCIVLYCIVTGQQTQQDGRAWHRVHRQVHLQVGYEETLQAHAARHPLHRRKSWPKPTASFEACHRAANHYLLVRLPTTVFWSGYQPLCFGQVTIHCILVRLPCCRHCTNHPTNIHTLVLLPVYSIYLIYILQINTQGS